VTEHDKAAVQARIHLEDVRKGYQVVENARQQATLARHYLETKKDTEDVGRRLRRIAQAQRVLTQYKKERGELVAPDAKTLRAIRKTVREREAARLQLDAALITLEIIPTQTNSLEIIVGEETGTKRLAPGKSTEVKGAPEIVISISGVGRLRARGPAGSAEELRAERDQAVRKLAELTRGFGTVDLEELEALHEQARELDKRVDEAETQLETLLSGDAIEKLDQEHTKARAISEEILDAHPKWKEGPPDAGGLEAAAEAMRCSFDTSVRDAEAVWEAARLAFTRASERRAGLAARAEETEKQLQSLGARIADLSADGRTEKQRATDLTKLALAWDAAKASLTEIEEQLQAFDEDPRTTAATLEKQRQSAEDEATKALETEKVAEGRLGSLAAQGLYSTLAEAEEEVVVLKEEIAREELRTNAVRLLRETVVHCRVEALAAVTGPVERVATRTLQRIAGKRFCGIQLGETFEPLHVLPRLAEIAVPLESVSGGEREQVYLATRLALAEVLAKEERQLVVLDDVLTATDTSRLARVLTILEEAAQRLQVLIITCHPERYRGLNNAQFFDLETILNDDSR
jgi:uncharacterized protein YhaN